MKSYFVALFLVVVLIIGAVMYGRHKRDEAISYRTNMVSMIQEVLKLALLDVQVSQMFEMKKDAITMMSIPIPLTSQKSLIVAEGKATLGYDFTLDNFDMDWKNKRLSVKLPEPGVLALDLNYRFVFENDTFLNRITPEDRNDHLETIKRSVRSTILNQNYKDALRKRVEELSKEVSTKMGITVVF